VGDDPGVTAPSNRPDPPTPRPLSNWTIAAGALMVLGIAAVIVFVLLRRYGAQGAQIQLDAIRTAGTLVIGTGGAVVLLLTARRQRYTELSLVHTDRDATERRITELYAKAADQLGSDKAPVRLAGLYALERLAHSTVEHRHTIVDVICAYLRMPYMPPDEQPPAEDAPAEAHTRHENRRQEQQVRLTAQHVLLHNMRIVAQHHRRWWHRAPRPAPAWPGIRLNLSGALLVNFSLLECQLDFADFTRARFTGDAKFGNTQFTGGWAYFVSAQFIDWADFEGALFTGGADFRDAQFTRGAHFNNAHFPDVAIFGGVQFADSAFFMGAQLRGALFEGAQFTGGVSFRMRSSSAWPTSREPSSGVPPFSKGPCSRAGQTLGTPSSPVKSTSRAPE
jgi:Pentapeptide repeats (9 copies)